VKTLYAYISREIITTLIMSVAIFTVVLLLGNIIREVFTLLFNEQATLGMVGKAILLLVPYVLVFALPMGMLTSALLVFGRWSSDQELTAVKSGGISIIVLVIPVLIISVLCSALCGFINLYWAPKSRVIYKDMLYDLGSKNPTSILSEGKFIKDIPGYIIYIGSVDGNNLYDVLISVVDKDGSITATLRAPSGRTERMENTNQFRLTLFNARGATIDNGKWQPLAFGEWSQILKLPEKQKRRLKLNELTIFQLIEEARKMERLLQSTQSIPSLLPGELREKLQEFKKPIYDFTMPIKVQINQQVSFSFACIGFTLLGIPLGIRAHRKETSIGVAISLVLILIYYSFFILASAIDTKSEYSPHLIVWIPNFLFQLIGGYLLWRTNRM